jgi:hypothetical protein
MNISSGLNSLVFIILKKDSITEPLKIKKIKKSLLLFSLLFLTIVCKKNYTTYHNV